MFCGIGGFRLGLEKASEEFRCVWSNDNDKYACQIYRKHFGEVHEGDIRAVDADAIPEHDLLCAGFPCQSFSIAGKRRGFEDTRGTLFFEICRVIRAKRPGYLWLENVKGLLSHDEGRTFETIIGTLDELGYDCQWQVLNSGAFVPQDRARLFFVANIREKSRPQIFPMESINEGRFTTDVDELCPHFPHPNNKDCRTCALSFCDSEVTYLTPLECERLQGFPDGWTEGISDTQRYKCLGNAVTVNVIEAIGKQLLSNFEAPTVREK